MPNLSNSKKKLIALGLVVIPAIPTLYYFLFSKQTNCYKWKFYEVCKIVGGYEVKFNNIPVVQTYYPPDKVINLGYVRFDGPDFLKNKTIYVLFEPDRKGNYAKVVGDFLMFKLPEIMAYNNIPLTRLKKGCLSNESLCKEYNFKVISPNCTANNTIYFIFEYSPNITTVIQKHDCIYIIGNDKTIQKSYSFLIYKLIGLI